MRCCNCMSKAMVEAQNNKHKRATHSHFRHSFDAGAHILQSMVWHFAADGYNAFNYGIEGVQIKICSLPPSGSAPQGFCRNNMYATSNSPSWLSMLQVCLANGFKFEHTGSFDEACSAITTCELFRKCNAIPLTENLMVDFTVDGYNSFIQTSRRRQLPA